MIRVRITGKNGAVLEQDLPTNINELHRALLEMGIRKTPRSILLLNDNAADVEFSSDSEIGSRLLQVFGEKDTLADANTVAFAVSTAREEILPELEQNIIHEQYLTKESHHRHHHTPLRGGPGSHCPTLSTRENSQEKGLFQAVNI